MDPKATAKSKRVHSLHGRRNHPSPSSLSAKKKASSSSASTASSSGGGAHSKGEAPRPRRRPELPSNWDRYDDGDDDDSGTVAGEASSAAMAQGSEILAKSKGADYRHLIEQARSQPQLQTRPIASFHDEFAFDFLQNSSSILSAKGEMLVSLCEDDNFVVDDFSGSSNHEVSFLSMDLNALAGQLSKLKMSRRLFLEDDDLFRDEMLVSEAKDNSEQVGRSAVLEDSSNAEGENESLSHISVEKIESLFSTSESPMETELDVLIDSFKETTVSRVSENSTDASSVFAEKKVASSLDDALDDLLAESSMSASDQTLHSISSKNDIIGTLHESIDDLLGQARMGVKKDNQAESSVDVLSSSAPAKQVDDFDSWFDSL